MKNDILLSNITVFFSNLNLQTNRSTFFIYLKMKKLIVVLVFVNFCMYACKEAPQKKQTPTKTVTSNTNNPKKSLATVAHYMCPKNCKGGASGMPGNCSVCSSVLSHNQAFHSSASKKSNAGFSPVAPPAFPVPNLPASAVQPGPNYAGQYHYTCVNGCAKGGNAAGKCNTCSGDLAHNVAFHQ
jgi:hypothetical protein